MKWPYSAVAGIASTILALAFLRVIPSAHAQNRFSDVVAYVRVQYAAGSNLVANPLDAGNNAISNVFRGVPNGSIYYGWEPGTGEPPIIRNLGEATSGRFRDANTYSSSTGWSDGNAAVQQPYGGFLWLPSPTVITFTGTVSWPVSGLDPSGCIAAQPTEVLSLVPELFVYCVNGPCTGPPPDDTQFCKWDAALQQWDCYYYSSGFGGWFPSTPTLFPGRAAFVTTPQAYRTRMRNGYLMPGPMTVSLHAARRTGSEISFELPSTRRLGYKLLRSTDLGGTDWTTVSESIASPTNGTIRIRAAVGNDTAGFYKLSSVVSPHQLVNASHSGSQFHFAFYGFSGTNYTVQRSTDFGGLWQPLMNVSGSNGLITVTDNNATAASGYYRVAY